jgi:hypothetical protein
MSVIVIGNTTKLAPNASSTANVANVATQTTTFHVCNATSNVYAYVGIFSTYAAAAAMDYPGVGSDAGGMILVPNESMTIEGNFGPAAIVGNVYCAAITASGTASVFFTPVAIGSTSG